MSNLALGNALDLEEDGGYFSGALTLDSFAPLTKDRRGRLMLEIEAVPPAQGKPAPSLAPEVRAGIAWLIHHEKEAAAAVTAALLAAHPRLGADLTQELEVQGLTVHKVAGPIPYLGFEFSSKRDREHGVGLMMHGTRLVRAGAADTALLEWIAERDATSQPAESAESVPPASEKKAKLAEMKPVAEVKPAAPATPKQATPKPPTAKKPAAEKPAAQKPAPAPKPPAKKPVADEPAPKPAAKKAAPAKKPAPKPAATKTAPSKKPAPKPAAKKAAPAKKPAPKPVPKKAAPPVAKKPAAKKAAPAKKPAPKKPAKKR